MGRRDIRYRDRDSPRVEARTLIEIGKTFGHSGTISVAITSSDDRELISSTSPIERLSPRFSSRTLSTPVKRLFPETVDNYAVVDDELIDVRRVSLVLEREAALRFTFTTNGLTLRPSDPSRPRRPSRSTRSSREPRLSSP